MTTPRRRRTPEQARSEILRAATQLIARDGPDGTSLRRIAQVADVTHALIVHYFGSYAHLVEEVLIAANQRYREQLRDRMRADHGIPYAEGVTAVLFELLADEQYLRLWAWTMLHAGPDLAPSGLAGFVDTLEEGIRIVLPGTTPDRARIEQVVLLALASSYGFALGHRSWLTGLGHDPDNPAQLEEFRHSVARILAWYLEASDDS
ncbi:TetR/AcrR family transcriptional regulator [Flexivirga caeni]|uniref:TetR/AcrR family transcriptional regulator n=1 Tax=Flexivirga caeni TaxID=2294115 RepID=A0A3M9MJG1_9MICO|nr:TetR/AcrR family transcriptional regulator [Flexivirga caeni]RNI25325.1 TetR/AcrR family transcriptional regulator [Flexivirga caeni]